MEKVENVKEIEEKEVVVEEPTEMVSEPVVNKKEQAIKIAKKVGKVAAIVAGGFVAIMVGKAIYDGCKSAPINPIENVDYTVEK